MNKIPYFILNQAIELIHHSNREKIYQLQKLYIKISLKKSIIEGVLNYA